MFILIVTYAGRHRLAPSVLESISASTFYTDCLLCVFINISVLLFFFFCLHRYMAIIHPLQQRMSSTETKIIVGVIWVLALLLAFPQYYYSTVDQLPSRVVCYIEWPEYTLCDFKKM